MKYLLAILAILVFSSAAEAQVCPAGSTCNGIENYTTNAPGGAASQPYGSGLRIPVAPGATNNTMQYIAANLLATLSGTQTLTNKTISCANNTCTVRANLDLTGALAAANFPTLTGDVTTPGASLATTISNLAVTTAKLNTAAVTYAKIQNGASAGLLGVNNGSAPTEVAVGSGLSLSAGTLSATGGGATTGFGVDGGTSAQTLTAGATLANGTRMVKIGSGWVTGTVTLQAISAVSADTCVRIEDGGNFIDGSHTLTVKGGVSDGLNGGAANGTIGPFTTAGSFVIACVSAANNWNVGPGTLAVSSAPSNQFANGVTVNGLSYAQPAITNISGLGTGVATAAAINLSAAGGLAKTVTSGAKALATSAISSAACTSAQTATATGTLTTDVVSASFNGDPTAVTGFVPSTSGMLTIIAYPTADTVNFKVCNNTSGSITPGAITINWRVAR